MAAIDVTYLHFENIHIISMKVNSARIVAMAVPKSSLRTYTSPNTPKYVALKHIVTVTI